MIYSNECFIKEECNKYIKGECTEDFCIKLFKLDSLYSMSLLTKEQRKKVELLISPSDPLEEHTAFKRLVGISKDIVNFVKSGKSLHLHSNKSGNGKTSWAIRLMQSYFNRIWAYADVNKCYGLFISVPKFLLALKDNISKESAYIAFIKENIMDADIVIWDDIATKGATDFEREHLLSIIDERINNGKCNIYTSNVQGEDCAELLGTRLASRIINLSENIEFKGVDKRSYARCNN